MPLYELTHDALTPLSRTTLAHQDFKERTDLQRLLKSSIGIIDPELMVIAEEFSQWEDSKRRIDLLAVDKQGQVVVIEIKRTVEGGFMDLQALRYAAMISTMTFQQAVDAYAKTLLELDSGIDPREALLDFLGSETTPENFAKEIRIVLVSADFSRELTTSVLWLNRSGLDIRCVRIRPHSLDGRTIVDVEQIIPLREAEEYTVRLKEKEEEIRQTIQADRVVDWTRYDLLVEEERFENLTKRELMWRVVKTAFESGLTLADIQKWLWAHKFFVLEGTLNEDEFFDGFSKARNSFGTPYDSGRYFLDSKHLLHYGNKTYALSNQWGKASIPRAEEIVAAIKNKRVLLTPREK